MGRGLPGDSSGELGLARLLFSPMDIKIRLSPWGARVWLANAFVPLSACEAGSALVSRRLTPNQVRPR